MCSLRPSCLSWPHPAGDLAKTNLGLKPEVYKQLAAEVDTIVHNGALVNHAFSYRQLFEPNVLGTVEVMKLAVATRVKAITFISSVGVVGGLDHPSPVTEEEVGTSLATELPGDGGYALGCAWPLGLCVPIYALWQTIQRNLVIDVSVKHFCTAWRKWVQSMSRRVTPASSCVQLWQDMSGVGPGICIWGRTAVAAQEGAPGLRGGAACVQVRLQQVGERGAAAAAARALRRARVHLPLRHGPRAQQARLAALPWSVPSCSRSCCKLLRHCPCAHQIWPCLAWGRHLASPRSCCKTVRFAGYLCLCCGCLTRECAGGLAVSLVKGCGMCR